jgi:hypothetical protein
MNGLEPVCAPATTPALNQPNLTPVEGSPTQPDSVQASAGVCIYTLNHPTTNELRYVGKTTMNLKSRLYGHTREKNHSPKSMWIKKLKLAGLVPKIEAVEYVESENWQQHEIFYISYFKFLGIRLLNVSPGGNGSSFHDESAIERIRKASIGRKRNPMSQAQRDFISNIQRGRKHSKETISKRAASNTGKKRTPEQCENIKAGRAKNRRPISEEQRQRLRVAHLGKKHSEETIAKMRASHKGFKMPESAIEKIRAWNTGRKMSDQAKDKMRASRIAYLQKTRRPLSETAGVIA